MLVVECLREDVHSGASTYPVYVGFLPASDISRVAEAPSFEVTTPNEQISTNIASQPVRDWQRPVDADRVDVIARTFDNSGSLMPNPVLLGQNAFVNGAITITPRVVPNTPNLTGTFEVNIDDSNLNPGQRPLWILDGQHRIAGLSKSSQRDNPVPVVFLLDGSTGAYTSPLLASLFAQVTTSATKLDELHNEWLTYAFQLDNYSAAKPNSTEARNAFEAAALLCRTPSYQNQGNPFYNAIEFNQHLNPPVQPSHGGFQYKCTTLKELLLKHYYGQPSKAGHHVPPATLAEQLATAYLALHAEVGHQQDSVFFGPPPKQQAILHDAYFIAVCAKLLASGTPPNWSSILQALNFQATNWDFSWVRSLSGPANTASKKIAISVLSEALVTGTLPPSSNNLADYFKGNAAKIQIAFSALTPQGRPKKAGRVEVEVLRGSTASQPAHHLPHLKVSRMSSNIGKLQVMDGSVRGRPVEYPAIQRAGMVLGGTDPNPMELKFVMMHYGNLHSEADLDVAW